MKASIATLVLFCFFSQKVAFGQVNSHIINGKSSLKIIDENNASFVLSDSQIYYQNEELSIQLASLVYQVLTDNENASIDDAVDFLTSEARKISP